LKAPRLLQSSFTKGAGEGRIHEYLAERIRDAFGTIRVNEESGISHHFG
jgi:hypothetical protein